MKTCAVAISETTLPEVRGILKKQLDEATLTHESITAYMIKKGYYRPFGLSSITKGRKPMHGFRPFVVPPLPAPGSAARRNCKACHSRSVMVYMFCSVRPLGR
ncbi:spore coat protein [Paenibacillus sp.]|uniref:spore coat protein n=1 Tax=Paenibacillus sp. TaxID=58172 RepID=UPI0028123C08|nr:spore coat protein [Paenibacillus sp.]